MWRDHGLPQKLKDTGIYNPEKIVISPVVVPPVTVPTYKVEEILKLTGDPKKRRRGGENVFCLPQIG